MIQLRKKIISEQDNLSTLLYNRRKSMGLNIDKIANELGVHPKYLAMLENGNYGKFPSKPYDHQIVRKYSNYLDLNFQKVWNLYKMEKRIFNELAEEKKKNTEVKEMRGSKKLLSFINVPRIILNTSFAVLVLVIVGYFSWSVYNSVQPPYLELLTPDDNLITKEHQINVTGRTESGIKVTINGQAVVNDDSGFFQKEIELHEGINMIKVTAAKKHEYENTIYRQIMVVEDNIGLLEN